MHQLPLFAELPKLGRPKSSRLVARLSVLLRREGGSLSITIPRHIVRHWKLEPGARLVVRSTDEGVLLYPRYFAPYVRRRRKRNRDGAAPPTAAFLTGAQPATPPPPPRSPPSPAHPSAPTT